MILKDDPQGPLQLIYIKQRRKNIMGCTTLLAGKNATYDGSTLMARNEDSGNGKFTPKKFIVVDPEDQPRLYKSVISKVEIPLPDDPMRYTAVPNAVPDEGIWGEAGINECNVAMSETETLTSNPRVLGADPPVKEGIGEEDMLTLVLPYIHSAKEGVLRLGSLIEEYGTYEMNGIGFQDVNEIWWFESVGGHHWIAKRVPDDEYVVMPNQQGIDWLDLDDAYGEQRNNMCCPDLRNFIKRNYLDLYMEPSADHPAGSWLDVRGALGSKSDSDHVYNTPRAWYMLRYFNPNSCDWDKESGAFSPMSDFLPWSMKPERKITIEDFKYVLSSYYQGTPYNPYDSKADPAKKGKFRPIGINRNNFLAVTQLRPYMPKDIMAIQWIAMASNAFNQLVPFYANVRTTPEYLANTGKEATTENFYWENRIIGALADAHFAACSHHIERYQTEVLALGHHMISESDQKYLEQFPASQSNAAEVQEFLEKCNQQIADMAKQETDRLLDKVLYTASLNMKNKFAMSDN